MENNPTAVEWLVEKLTNRQNGVLDDFSSMSLDEIYEQAKAMEKEQIDKALTPIELPSEEELAKEWLLIFEKKGYNMYTHYNQVPIWIEGAKWVINKIKQQDNGQN
jgi:hypothetical protein